jgi:hypothetical protein
MPLTRVDGDFSQVSNIVRVTVPEAPSLQIFIGWMDGETFLVPADLSVAVESGFVDTSIGYINGYEVNDGGSILGAYGAYLEGGSAGASRSGNFSATWAFDSAPIYVNAPPRHSRVAFGNGTFLHAGTRNTGSTLAALSADFSNSAFSWTSDGGAIQDGIGLDGCNGIDFVAGFFYGYGVTGTIGRSADGLEWTELTNGMPAPSFQSSNSLPYARFAGNESMVIGFMGGRIIVSEDGGLNFVDTYADAFINETQVGGAGFNEPYMCGIAYGGGAWVAVGNYDTSTSEGEGPGLVGSPLICRSSVGAEVLWPEVTIPTTVPPITQMLDVVYDEAGGRFLALGRSIVEDTLPSGGVVVFEAQEIAGAGGSDKNGVLTVTMQNFIGAPTTSTPSGTVISGSVAGSGEFGLASFSGSGTEWVFSLRVPAAELRNDPENDYISSIEITPGITNGVIPTSSAWNFNALEDPLDSNYVILKWQFSGLLLDRMDAGTEYTATFGGADLPSEITSAQFHLLQSTDGGVTFTAELTREYQGLSEKDKGWIKLVPADDGSNFLQQEDLFFILQEDGFNIIIEDNETFFRVLEDGDLRLMEDVDSRLLEGAP